MHPHFNSQEVNSHGETPETLDDELGRMRAALEVMQAENEQLRDQVAGLTANRAIGESVGTLKGKASRWLTDFGNRFTVGSDLDSRIDRLMRAWRSEGRVPDREVAAVVAGVMQWGLRMSQFVMFAGLTVVIAVFLILWQNVLIQREIAQQEQITEASRRAALISTLYERRDCDAELPADCPLRASNRERAEAAVAFVALERASDRNLDPDLTSVDLSGGNLANVNFWRVTLIEANLQNALLGRATLQEAYLRSANLQEASLGNANLREAFLWSANLRGAFLQEADLRRANLQEVDLRGADLRGALLHGADLHGAIFDEQTQWPNGFDPVAAGAQQATSAE